MKILIVDDHAYNRELLSFILVDEGHECVDAKNGREACDIYAKDQDVDVILMDVNMPEMDGVSATKIIKEQEGDRHVPVIFVTALDDAEMLAKCLDAGGDDFVPKPVNENVLLAKINAHGRIKKLYNHLHDVNQELAYHQKVMDREHTIVERIFNRGANRITSDCANVQKYTSPMSMFNGDIILEAPSPSGGVFNLVGDFTGHGLAASIGTLPVSEIFYRLASEQASVGQFAREINKSMVDLLPVNMFFCGCITYLDRHGKNLALWSGGMNDLLLTSALDDSGRRNLTKIASEHMPLGILTEEEFDDTPSLLELNEGDHLYVYTDGINEAANEAGEEFGLDRLESIIVSHVEGSDVLREIVSAVHAFQAGSAQNDDLSLLEISASELVHRDKNSHEVVNVIASSYSAESFPWRFTMCLRNEELRNTSIVEQLMSFVGSIQGIELHREKIFTIFSELYSNALEHGVLGLQSSMKATADGFEEYYRLRKERLSQLTDHSIDLDFSFVKGTPCSVRLQLTDSGLGFDFDEVNQRLNDDSQSHGRGIHLLRTLCSTLEYSNEGRTVNAVYDLCLTDSLD